MTIAPMYPQTTWECGVCGTTNPGDIGECTNSRCRRGSLQPRGGLNVEEPYLPYWHYEQAGEP